MKQLILGGIKSGKSRLAESLASSIERESGSSIIYLASSHTNDTEMQTRVKKHQASRPSHWQTIEEPLLLADTLQKNSNKNTCLLIDCLTLWITNLLMQEDESMLTKEVEKLITILPSLPGDIIFVSNETSMGIIPLGELTRRFCDETGLLHQKIASHCDRVILTVAGLPHTLKGTPL